MSTGFDNSAPFNAFALDDVDPDRPGSGGGGRLPGGGYKFRVVEVVVQDDKGRTLATCEVLDAKDKNLIGRRHIEKMRWPKPDGSEVGNRIAKEILLAWCYATKTTSAEIITARQQARQGFDPSWLDAMVGRELLGFVKEEAYTGTDGSDQTSAKCEGRVWAVDNPKGKGIPGWIGSPSPAAGSGAATNAGPVAPTTPPPTTATPPAADPFGGLV
jgi:hypothetical protein